MHSPETDFSLDTRQPDEVLPIIMPHSRREVRHARTRQEKRDIKTAHRLVGRVLKALDNDEYVVDMESRWRRGTTSMGALALAQIMLDRQGVIVVEGLRDHDGNKTYEGQYAHDKLRPIRTLHVVGTHSPTEADR